MPDILTPIKDLVKTYGASALSDLDLLTALLAYAKQKEPKDTADRLLARFSSLGGVLRVSSRDLVGMNISSNAAILLSLILPLWGRAVAEQLPKDVPLTTASKTSDYLTARFMGTRLETAYLLLLRKDFTVIDCVRIAEGSINSTSLNARAMAEAAVFAEADYAILAHNHPGGTVSPSRNDISATERLFETFDTIGVPLLEHFIIAGCDHLPILWATNAISPFIPAGYYDKEYPHITRETP